jgi:hypothetical protein
VLLRKVGVPGDGPLHALCTQTTNICGQNVIGGVRCDEGFGVRGLGGGKGCHACGRTLRMTGCCRDIDKDVMWICSSYGAAGQERTVLHTRNAHTEGLCLGYDTVGRSALRPQGSHRILGRGGSILTNQPFPIKFDCKIA